MSHERSWTGLPLKATKVTRSFTLSGIGGITTFITEVKPAALRHRQRDSSVIQKLLSLSRDDANAFCLRSGGGVEGNSQKLPPEKSSGPIATCASPHNATV